MGSGHSFADSTRRYEAWLAQYCKIDDVGLAAKREKIKAAPFPFLRGTFYRWPHHFPRSSRASPKPRRSYRSATPISRISAPGATRRAATPGA